MEQSRRDLSLEANIFYALYSASTEDAVDKVFTRFPKVFGDDKNWYPLGATRAISA